MKKVYRKPRVESEERLEQTSLACTQRENASALNFDATCANDVSKNGSFTDSTGCDVWVLQDPNSCNPIEVGTLLS